MIKNKTPFMLFYILCFLMSFTMALAQKSVPPITTPLKLGEAAPPIKAAYWIKGQPITSFEKGKVYILDFWATWCKYCIASMPHMSELSTKYQNRVVVLGVDVMEAAPKGTDAVEFNKKKVIDFVHNGAGKAMNFASFSDTPDDFMQKNWVTGQQWFGDFNYGIPFTVIVDKNGNVAWIGFATDYNQLDKALDDIVNDKFDIETFKKYCANIPVQREQERQKKEQERAKLAADPVLEPLKEAINNSDFKSAIQLAYKIEKEQPRLSKMVYSYKVKGFEGILGKNPELFLSLVKVYEKPVPDSILNVTHTSLWVELGLLVAKRQGLDDALYRFAIDALQPVYRINVPNGRWVEGLARLYYRRGEKVKAIALAQMMIDKAQKVYSEDEYFMKLKKEFENNKS